MGISFYTDWDKANQNDSEAQEHEVIEDLTVAFLTVVQIIFKASRIQATTGNSSYIMQLSKTLEYFILWFLGNQINLSDGQDSVGKAVYSTETTATICTLK